MTAEQQVIPTISRVLSGGTMVELLFDPAERSTALAIARPDGRIAVESAMDLPTGERLIPYTPTNNLVVNECVLLPSSFAQFSDKPALLAEVQAFLHRYVDLSSTFEAIAAHYVLLSWVYDAFSDVPYLRLRGDFGTGKTRALLAIGSLCYKPFFASGASTISPIFHILDRFGGTLVLDEADLRFSDATAQLTKVLNNGTTKGLPVLRTMTNRNRELNPQAFKVYGPKIIAMREQFSDVALESRFLTEETSARSMRSDVPIHLPASFKDEARELRNKLLAWRFRVFATVRPDPSRALTAVAPRYRQTTLSLLSLVDDAALRASIGGYVAEAERRVLQDRAETTEALMLQAIMAALDEPAAANAAVGDIARSFNALAAESLGRPMSNKWVGGFIRTRLRLATLRTNGVYVVPRTER